MMGDQQAITDPAAAAAAQFNQDAERLRESLCGMPNVLHGGRKVDRAALEEHRRQAWQLMAHGAAAIGGAAGAITTAKQAKQAKTSMEVLELQWRQREAENAWEKLWDDMWANVWAEHKKKVSGEMLLEAMAANSKRVICSPAAPGAEITVTQVAFYLDSTGIMASDHEGIIALNLEQTLAPKATEEPLLARRAPRVHGIGTVAAMDHRMGTGFGGDPDL
jgi:hypothetical protein